MANLIDNDAKVITPGDYGYGHPTVVSFDDGTLFSGFINDLGNLEIHKSINNGVNWALDTTITPSSSIVYFNLCYRHTASVDELFVLYSDGANDYKVQKRADGGSWSQVLSFSLDIANKKALIRFDRSLDRLQIFWIGQDNIKSKYSDNGGSSWSDGANYVRGGAYYLGDFDIHPTNNNIVVCGQRQDHSTQWWWIFDKAGTFVSSNNESLGGNDTQYTNVLYDSGGNMSRIRERVGTISIFGRGATSWSVAVNNLKAAMDGDDNIYIFYTKTSDEKVYYRKYDAGISTWGSETLLVNVANNKFNCQKHSIPSETVLNYIYYTA